MIENYTRISKVRFIKFLMKHKYPELSWTYKMIEFYDNRDAIYKKV